MYIYFANCKNKNFKLLKLSSFNIKSAEIAFIKVLPIYWDTVMYPFNLQNFNKCTKIFRINNNYLFCLNVYFFIKSYKKLANMLFLNFTAKKHVIFFNGDLLVAEIKSLYYYLHTYNFFNIYDLLLKFLKKSKSKVFLKIILNKIITKYNINIMVLLNFNNLHFFYKIAQSCNLPIVGLQT